MHTVRVLSLLGLAGCASSGAIGPARPAETVRASGGASMTSGSTGVSIVPSSSEVNVTIASPINVAWRAMPGVYQTLKIPLTTLDQQTHTIGNEGLKALKNLGGVPLSKYLDCGNSQIGPNADSYDVHLSIVSQLVANANGTTKLVTNLVASARPLAYAQEYSHCSSKGVLEAKLVDELNAALAKKL
jgi:hypothetical protein